MQPTREAGGRPTKWSERDRVLSNFLVGERLKQIPARRKKLLVVLAWLAEGFQAGERYPEREVNERLLRHYPDFATLRRLLVDYGFFARDHGVYWRTAVAKSADEGQERLPLSASDGGTVEEARPQAQWYAMLFPSPEESTRLAAQLSALARLTGGTVYESLHVTVGYFTGRADPTEVVELARTLDRPSILVRAAGLFSWSEDRDPSNGYTLSLQVIRDDGIREWQRRAIGVLSGAALEPTFPWDDQNPHMMVLRDLPATPAEVLVRLGSQDFGCEFRATRLVVSQRVGERYVTWLDQALGDVDQ